MVEMIPDIISETVKSGAERKLFKEFREYTGNENYIILHSLGVSEHIHNIFGEIDFVVISSKGVLCVEVKGGEVGRARGLWTFTNRYLQTTSKPEGPFQQAQGNMHSLRVTLKKKLGKYDPLVRCQYACCVIMPECNFTYDSTDIIRDILFDLVSYRGLDDCVNRSFQYWGDLMDAQHGFRCDPLTNEEMKRLANILRGDFRFVPPMKNRIDATAKELHELTNEQYEVLESLDENERTLVSGVAGAGKTLLAIEQARRIFWMGKSVLYTCFNRNIAAFVQYQFMKENLDIKARTLHSIMLEECGSIMEGEYDSDFFEDQLPEKFLDPELDVCRYDYVIVDEGQDVLRNNYVSCIDRLVEGGLASGHWLMFYDQNQNIFNYNDELEECISKLKQKAASFKLTVNCRNTKQIADANILATGISNIGRPKVSGMSVGYVAYENRDDEYIKIRDLILSLRNEGIRGNDFVVLSKYSITNPKNCLYERTASVGTGRLKVAGDMWNAEKDDIRVCTISAFKGLEAKLIILTDVDEFSEKNTRLLNYVAISRAVSKLYILYDKGKEEQRQQMLFSGFMKI